MSDKSKKERLLDITRDDGRDDNMRGVPRDANPYFVTINPNNYYAWRKGWDEAEKEFGPYGSRG